MAFMTDKVIDNDWVSFAGSSWADETHMGGFGVLFHCTDLAAPRSGRWGKWLWLCIIKFQNQPKSQFHFWLHDSRILHSYWNEYVCQLMSNSWRNNWHWALGSLSCQSRFNDIQITNAAMPATSMVFIHNTIGHLFVFQHTEKLVARWSMLSTPWFFSL